MNIKQQYRSFLFIVLFSVIAGGLGPRVGLHQEKLPDGELLKDATGEELKKVIRSYRGEKAVLVNVWATWCAPCVEEFPEIVKIQRKYADELRVIFVSTDFPEGRDRALEFLKKQGVDWTTYFKTGKDESFIEAISTDWTGAMPFTKVLDKEGKIVASWENSASFSKFDKHVKEAINP